MDDFTKKIAGCYCNILLQMLTKNSSALEPYVEAYFILNSSYKKWIKKLTKELKIRNQKIEFKSVSLNNNFPNNQIAKT